MCLLNVNLFDFSSYAEDSEVTEIYLTANVNGQSQKLSALQNKDGNLFLSSSVLSDITVYKYIAESSKFIHDSSDGTSKYREIWITGEKPQINVVSYQMNLPVIKKTIDLPDVLDYNGEKYFPLAELLPTLNSNATIIDKCLYIEDVPYSMTNIMSEFNISEYMFNMYDDNDFLGLSDTKILAGYSYLFNGLVNFDLKRFVPIGAYIGREESYEEIFTSYLAEDETYFAAINEEEHYIIPAVDYMLGDDADRENAIVEAFDALYDISDKEHDELIKTFTTLDSYTTEYSSIEAISTASKGIDFGLKASAYIELYFNHVTDHYEMIDSVYDIENNQKHGLKLWFNGDEQLKAADTIYSQYNSEKRSEIIKYIAEQIGRLYVNEFKSGLSSGGSLTYAKLGASISKLFFIATDFHVYNVAQKCENLGYYNKLMERGISKLWSYNNTTNNLSHEAIEDARLSAIFTLLSSRSMYQAFLDSEKAYGNSGGVYQRKIDSINEILKKLYLAKNCCLTDSEEYIDERIAILNTNIASIGLTNETNDNKYFDLYKSYFLDNYSLDDLVCLADVTHDGIDDMIVITDDENVGDIKFSMFIKGLVYTVVNNEVKQIYEKNGCTSHSGGFFCWYLTESGNLADEVHSMWQGMGEVRFDEYYITNSGERIEQNSIVLSSETPEVDENGHVTSEAQQKYINAVDKKMKSSYLLYSVYTESTVAPKIIELDPRKVFEIEDNESKDDLLDSDKYENYSSLSLNAIGDLSNIEINIPAIIIAPSGLTLRTEPNQESSDIGVIPCNTKVKIISLCDSFQIMNGKINNWVKIEYKNQTGYVCADYIYTDVEPDVSSFSDKQWFAIGILLYHQYFTDSRTMHLPRKLCIEDCYEEKSINDVYCRKILPKSLTIDILVKEYYNEFSRKYNSCTYENYIKEHEEYLWQPTGFGGDVDFYYSEIISVDLFENKEIFFTVVEHYYGFDNVDSKEVEFSIIYEDGHWKCGKISSNA